MKKHFLSDIAVTLFVIVLYCTVKYVAVPVYAEIAGEIPESREGQAISSEASAVDEGNWRSSRDHRQFIDYATCITIVKNADGNEHPAYVVNQKRSETPEYLFSYGGWRGLTPVQKKALVSGSMTFLHEVLKLEICHTEKEKRRYDRFRTMVSVAEIVKHVDSKFRKTEYQDEDGEWFIVDYLQYNFWNYMADPIAEYS